MSNNTERIGKMVFESHYHDGAIIIKCDKCEHSDIAYYKNIGEECPKCKEKSTPNDTERMEEIAEQVAANYEETVPAGLYESERAELKSFILDGITEATAQWSAKIEALKNAWVKEQHTVCSILAKAMGNVVTKEIKDAVGGEIGEPFYSGDTIEEVAVHAAKEIEALKEKLGRMEGKK